MRARIIALTLFLAGCGEGFTFFKSTPTFYPTAQQNYDYAIKELKSGNFQTAIQFFNHIRQNFGFSKWSTLAELGIADANMGRQKYLEAIEDYKQFIKAHPSHERVTDGYAAFKIGECYSKQIPNEWFLSPPSYEKDQGPVIEAMRELTSFVEQYAKSPYLEQARKLLDRAVRRLADHELYVAKFYLNRNKPLAAIGRLERLTKEYPGAQREPETLLLLGKTYMKMEKFVEARAIFEKLAATHPDDYRANKAKLYIQFIDKRIAQGYKPKG